MNQIYQTKSIQSNVQSFIQQSNFTKSNPEKPNLQKIGVNPIPACFIGWIEKIWFGILGSLHFKHFCRLGLVNMVQYIWLSPQGKLFDLTL